MENSDAVSDWVRHQNGVAHSSLLRAAGFSAHAISCAVDRRQLLRVRRSWLVTPDCDERRRAAARVGGRVTCASAAALRGWWTVATDSVHVALPHSASRYDSHGITVHRAKGPVPVHARSTDEPVLNVLFHTARCLPRRDALSVWEAAVRAGDVDLDVLERVDWGSSAAASVARLVCGRSDSGPETVFVERMRAIGVTVRQQVWVDGHPLDGLIGDRLGVQIDGFAHHSSAADRRRDLRADARLALRGYTLLRFDYQQVMHDPRHVEEIVQTALSQGLHLRQSRKIRQATRKEA